jgi:hypothetical protein
LNCALALQAIKAALPAFSTLVHSIADGPQPRDISAPPTPTEAKCYDLLRQILHSLAQSANNKLFCSAPEYATNLAIVPVTNNDLVDARLIVQLLGGAECAPLLRKILEWQNKLRLLLLNLLTVRDEVTQVCSHVSSSGDVPLVSELYI